MLVGSMKMNTVKTILLCVAFALLSCSACRQAEASSHAMSRLALVYLLKSEQKPTDEINRFRKIVEELHAKGDTKAQVLIRTMGQPSQDQVELFDLASGDLKSSPGQDVRGLYQFVVYLDDPLSIVTVFVANLRFSFRVENSSLVFEKSEAEEISPPLKVE